MTEKKKNPAVGIFDNMSFEDYCKINAINNSGLKTFHLTAAHYKEEKEHPRPSTQPFRVGQAIHCLATEPELFDSQFIQSKHLTFQSNEAKAWKEAAHEAGLVVLSIKADNPDVSPCEWDFVHRSADALRTHPIASILINGVAERTIVWVDKGTSSHKGTGKLCKARIDVSNEDHDMLVDIKSAEDASLSGFSRAVHSYGYFRQNAWYMDGAQAEDIQLNVLNGFTFVVVEKRPPWAVACYKLEPEWIRVGREMNNRDLDNFKTCHDDNEWPCYPEEIRDLVMPAYAKYHPIS